MNRVNLILLDAKTAKNEWLLIELRAFMDGRAVMIGRRVNPGYFTGDYLTAEWSGSAFYGGAYDLTIEEARKDFELRSVAMRRHAFT